MRYIQTESELKAYVEAVIAAPPPALAMDLEGESNRHRYGFHVCLFQFYDGTESVLIDSVEIKDMSPLEAIIAHPDICKVAYATDFDVRLLHLVYGWRIHNLYDVQLAAKELGHQDIALPFLLEHYLKLVFVKNGKMQRSNWNLRPLTKEHLEYAALDVRYLLDLHAAMDEKIREKGLEKKLAARNRAAENHRFQTRHRPWMAIKGAGALAREQKIVLKHLYEAREKVSRQLDFPPYWVIPNEKMLDLAAEPLVTVSEWSGGALLTAKAKPFAHVFAEAVAAANSELEARKINKG